MTTMIPQVPDSSVRYLATAQAYDLWSTVYDTDGNFLQALDTIEMKTLLPRMLQFLDGEPRLYPRPWKVVDLGCGTGRNTAALLEVQAISAVVGLDVSPGMLEVAKKRLQKLDSQGRLRLEVFDALDDPEAPHCAIEAVALVSTLVLEHIPVDTFFNVAAKILKPGGILLLTNMHSEMGAKSQAGFVDPKTSEKIRPTSYAHTLEEVLAAAARSGFNVLGKIEERAVDQSMVAALGRRSEKWVGVKVWFGGLLQKRD